jgi:hypothetical protein
VARIPGIEHATDDDTISDLYGALIRDGRKAVPKLLPYLRDPRPRVRAFASAVVHDLPVQEGDLDALIAAHRGGDQCALRSIARVGSVRAARYLVTQIATRADLWKYASGIPDGAPGKAELAGYLRSPIPRPNDALETLCAFLRPIHDAVDPLVVIAADRQLPLANRLAAVRTLGCIGQAASSSTPSLHALAASDVRFADQIRETLDRLGEKTTLRTAAADLARARACEEAETCGTLLERDNWDLLRLGELGEPAVPLLLHQLELKPGEVGGDVRLYAIAALGAIGDRLIVPALVRLLDDPDDWRAVFLAVESLGRMGAMEALTRLDGVAASHWFASVREIAAHVATELRGSGKVTDLPPSLGEINLRIHRPVESPAVATSEPLDTLEQDELEQHPIPELDVPVCGLPYARPFLVTPRAGLETDEGVYLAISRRWGSGLFFQRDDKTKWIVRGSVPSVFRIGAHIVAIVPRGVAIDPYGPRENEELISNGPQSGALYRIERQRGGRHKAIPWKVLPGYCSSPPGLLKDGRIFLTCQSGDVIIRSDGTLESPDTATQ